MTAHRFAAALLALGTAFAARAEPSTTISGKVFVDYTYRRNVDDATGISRDAGTGTAFDEKRFYVTIDHVFDDVWRARFRTDMPNLVSGKADVFVKNAYLEAKLAPELDLQAGVADLPWFGFADELYGFRYVEQNVVDRVKLGNSADWGLHASGKLGLLAYAVSVSNGRGYGDPTRTRSPSVEGRLSTTIANGLTIGIGATAGKLGQNVVGVDTPRTATRANALVAWVGGGVRLGATVFYANDFAKDIVTGAAPEDKARGGSAWAAFEIFPKVTVFGRGDYVQPKVDGNSGLKDVYFNAGVQYQPVKKVDVALVYKHERVRSGTISTGNGVVGTSTAGETGTYQEVGAFAEMAF